MLLQAAGQLPDAVAPLTVGVGFILRPCAGQSRGVQGLFHLPEAFRPMHVDQDFLHPADPVSVLVVAFLRVGMWDDLRLLTGKHRLCVRVRLRGLFADQDLVPFIAFIRMDMCFRRRFLSRLHGFIAFFPMGVVFVLREFTDEFLFPL